MRYYKATFRIRIVWNGTYPPNIEDEQSAFPDLQNIRCLNHVFFERSCLRITLADVILKSQGFKRVFNVSGGIHAYAVKADPSVPTY